MSKRRITQEQIAKMEKMMIEYGNGYAKLYKICYELTKKLDELQTKVNNLSSQSNESFSILGDK